MTRSDAVGATVVYVLTGRMEPLRGNPLPVDHATHTCRVLAHPILWLHNSTPPGSFPNAGAAARITATYSSFAPFTTVSLSRAVFL